MNTFREDKASSDHEFIVKIAAKDREIISLNKHVIDVEADLRSLKLYVVELEASKKEVVMKWENLQEQMLSLQSELKFANDSNAKKSGDIDRHKRSLETEIADARSKIGKLERENLEIKDLKMSSEREALLGNSAMVNICHG